jgi:hypothetical protein
MIQVKPLIFVENGIDHKILHTRGYQIHIGNYPPSETSHFSKNFFLHEWAPKGVKWITNLFKKGWILSNQSIK